MVIQHGKFDCQTNININKSSTYVNTTNPIETKLSKLTLFALTCSNWTTSTDFQNYIHITKVNYTKLNHTILNKTTSYQDEPIIPKFRCFNTI